MFNSSVVLYSLEPCYCLWTGNFITRITFNPLMAVKTFMFCAVCNWFTFMANASF